MSNFPNALDDDSTIISVNDNISDLGSQALDELKDAVINIENNIGIGAQGSTTSIAYRIGVSINLDGTINPSALTSLGLVTLPITNNQISVTAAIPESKLQLNYPTQNLYNYIENVSNQANTALGWVSISGVKLEPHLMGAIYRHDLTQINVNNNPSYYFLNKFNTYRNNTNSFTAINDMNSELLFHQFADGTPSGTLQNVITNGGASYPSYYAHYAGGIYIDPSRFATIPDTVQDVQSLAEYLDDESDNNILEDLFSNGISETSRSSILTLDGYGSPVVPPTPCTSYLLNLNNSSSPYDSITTGDDIIQFTPTTGTAFDEQFALVNVGDTIRINYGPVETSFIIIEKKYIQGNPSSLPPIPSTYIVRINSKNLYYTQNAIARIDRSLVNSNKYGVLSMAAVNNNFGGLPSITIGSATCAQALGIGFSPDQLDSSHYNLYLVLYPTGSPLDGYIQLPPIDVTGNQGQTTGTYTLDNIVAATNAAFSQPGFNYRFMAFSYQGNFGIMLSDSYNNAGFSIFNAIVNNTGSYDTSTTINFPNNVVDVFPVSGRTASDPLGLGQNTGNLASPLFTSSYVNTSVALLPTKLFLPLKRNNFYVNGIQQDRLAIEQGILGYQVLDGYGDGYWIATIESESPTFNNLQVTYRIPYDLSATHIKVGQTLVVQPMSLASSETIGTSFANYGRFIIQSIAFTSTCSSVYTDITVYDAVHGLGYSQAVITPVGTQVSIYFSYDTVSFDAETATDFSIVSPFNRFFEILIDQNGRTFTHERARINVSGNTLTVNSIPLYSGMQTSQLNIVKVSYKLKGYLFGGGVTKITLFIISYNNSTGVFSGYLCYFNGSSYSKIGATVTGKVGNIIRFYDDTNLDYIDIIYEVDESVSSFTNQIIDFQLFPSLALDQELMLLGTCQLSSSNTIQYLKDERQFGNVSENDLSTSALNYISLPEKLLRGNGIIRGFDVDSSVSFSYNGRVQGTSSNTQVSLSGGLALVNGKFVQLNNQIINFPTVYEIYGSQSFNVNWAICINDKGDYEIMPLLDYDLYMASDGSVLQSSSNIGARVIELFNEVSNQSYYVDSLFFTDILNNRRDLLCIYIAGSIIESGGIGTISLKDVRKYVIDIDENIPLVLTGTAQQGNFKTLDAVINWATFNTQYSGTILLKGGTIFSAPQEKYLVFNFANHIIVDGGSSTTTSLTLNNTPQFSGDSQQYVQMGFGSNATIKNITININNMNTLNYVSTIPFIAQGAQNLSFENCIFNIVLNSGILCPLFYGVSNTSNAIININGCSNIKFNNCIINFTFSAQSGLIPSISGTQPQLGNIFNVINTTNFVMDNSSVYVNYTDVSNNLANIIVGDIFSVQNCSFFTVKNSTFNGNFNKFLSNTTYVSYGSLSNLELSNLTITGTTTPQTTVPYYDASSQYPDITYNTSNLVNNGQGWIYLYIADAASSNVKIDNVSFIYSPSSAVSDRFSFINIQFGVDTSILSNLIITNCSFNNSSLAGSGINDYRAAISIINSSINIPYAVTFPTLFNANISNNTCSQDQMIILTSNTSTGPSLVTSAYNFMGTPGLVPQNVKISNNICGTISYWVESETVPGQINSKMSGLLIDNNICHYINNADSTGMYFALPFVVNVPPYIAYTTTRSDYASGKVIISNNKCNWIHTSIAYEDNSSLHITKNTLNAYDPAYLNNFNEGTTWTAGGVTQFNGIDSFILGAFSAITPLVANSWQYAIFVGSNVEEGSSNIGNAPGALVSPLLAAGSNSSCIISENIIDGGIGQNSGTIYLYNLGYIFAQSSSVICNNICKGVTETSGTGALILLGGNSHIVTGNKVYRNQNTIFAYVSYGIFQLPLTTFDGSMTKGIISNNYFDSPWTDNTGSLVNEQLVTGSSVSEQLVKLTPINAKTLNWTVNNNINQTNWIAIPLTNGFGLYGGSMYSPITVLGGAATDPNYVKPDQGNTTPTTTDYTLRSNVLALIDSSIGMPPVGRSYYWQENIDKYLPIGSRPVSIQFYVYSTTALDPGSNINVYLSTVPSIPFYNIASFTTGAYPGYLIDNSIGSITSIPQAGVSGSNVEGLLDIELAPSLVNGVTTDVSYNYVSGNGESFSVTIQFLLQRQSSSVQFNVHVTPLYIKYRW